MIWQKERYVRDLNFHFLIYRLSFVFMPCLLCHRAVGNRVLFV